MEITEVLRRGIVTEKTVKQQEQNKYTFEVALKATKVDVRRAIETLFNVKVEKVNIMRMPGKARLLRRRGAYPRPIEAREWKKAIVTLSEGQTIDALKA
ncbi:large subunit ribosomal protein L23 [Thermosporothrix hazakensis]|uniref:Large ribosomal subunit protein uL23 n=2 Tax=Thermosporothrix TaxID=768650 RepID=A0A326U0X9_THEHA|nr:50S ribosomal protein L23 [Thermosporothrix hazakensis]PZW23273.1 large subunit ribosomal protein L23 [Thermosporothrix hazakensis]BBH89614.1 50S ribosomal protein L23 [Thermosporothrix sp. COM3]GCE47800.1 50S ribosomal protein L23 [Thermosporothrix hazakensis]